MISQDFVAQGNAPIQFLAQGTYTVRMVNVTGSTPVTGVVVAEAAESTQDFQFSWMVEVKNL